MVWRTLGRIVRGGLVAAVLLALAMFTVVQVGQRVLRRRAERLAAEVQGLRVGVSGFEDLNGFRTRWAGRSVVEPTCNGVSCLYSINMTDWTGEIMFADSEWAGTTSFKYEMWLLRMLHAHSPWVTASVTMEGGVVSAVSFRVETWVHEGYGSGNGDDFAVSARWSITREPVQSLRGSPEGQPSPDANAAIPHCTGSCGLVFATTLGPRANKAVRLQLESFNWDCLTRWKPCTTEADLMPAAWEFYERQSHF